MPSAGESPCHTEIGGDAGGLDVGGSEGGGRGQGCRRKVGRLVGRIMGFAALAFQKKQPCGINMAPLSIRWAVAPPPLDFENSCTYMTGGAPVLETGGPGLRQTPISRIVALVLRSVIGLDIGVPIAITSKPKRKEGKLDFPETCACEYQAGFLISCCSESQHIDRPFVWGLNRAYVNLA